MKILVTDLPNTDWWGKGMPLYANNWLMAQGNIPRPEVVRDAHARLVAALQKITNVVVLPFPAVFDVDHLYKHDFVFTRDSFISVGSGNFVISNFSERQRQDEAESMKKYLQKLGMTIHILPNDAYAEGGEFYIPPKDNLMFAGVNRNNRKGVQEVAKIGGIQNVCIVDNPGFHLDTNFCVLVGENGHCVGVIACLSVIKNREEVIAFCQSHHLTVLDVDPIDGMGTPDAPGSFAANSQAFPGKLVGCARFETPGIEKKIKELGIEHIVVPLYDLKFSGGSVHCLTNELEY